MPHFQLVTVDGDVLGTRELGRPDWPPGSIIYTELGEPNLRSATARGYPRVAPVYARDAQTRHSWRT